jgi:hypothetical protein
VVPDGSHGTPSSRGSVVAGYILRRHEVLHDRPGTGSGCTRCCPPLQYETDSGEASAVDLLLSRNRELNPQRRCRMVEFKCSSFSSGGSCVEVVAFSIRPFNDLSPVRLGQTVTGGYIFTKSPSLRD